MMEKKGVEIHWLQPGSKEERIEEACRTVRSHSELVSESNVRS